MKHLLITVVWTTAIVTVGCCPNVDSLGTEGGGGAYSPECTTDVDCDQTWSGDCAEVVCDDGFCREQKLTADNACADDLGAQGQCWGGQCCFTCLLDDGTSPAKLDSDDGPCVSGKDDSACGSTGYLCQDCASVGQVCIQGVCVAPECNSAADCDDANDCTLNYCVTGKCDYPDDTSGPSCLDPNTGTMGTCDSGWCVTCDPYATIEEQLVACEDDDECTDGRCLRPGFCAQVDNGCKDN